MMGEMRKVLCQNTNIVTREEKWRSNRIMGKILFVRQENKQTNKKQNTGPATKVSNFQEAAGDIRVPVRNKERNFS